MQLSFVLSLRIFSFAENLVLMRGRSRFSEEDRRYVCFVITVFSASLVCFLDSGGTWSL